ncbi:hypothetical protein A3G14_00780 [Candidatus Curtissbacteria bacterium RIFCSPLOWO2_12_FULL_38_9]|uniref:Thioredoxin domain-containing protein n=2 Tax=Candidatus Curtissiibacteriota TaxID=1752717 RepID=A0A1F5G6P7_9BACT|nr:MAG: hypothetical protein A2775_02380 [Candidatus Curtissbacteria bacterium RIFCSPHIGHO2_01_FULL_39_57]OGD87553.1 MAG: hypothetical protein A3D04_04700 [Candidatus Curtissbacteria bacterium RIFCSPHIGHO2_02_FULL_40_16b]OGE12092.1 MAG: hypothetical protein A3G14_00780 [Candidatus Curtissbacteria bacterium RIFCSPLOWO2_12_FULL_38_9]
MSSEHKFLLGFAAVTVVIILIGAFFLGKQSDSQQTSGQAQQTVDQSELISNAPHTVGDPGAAVVVVEFADLQCPACRSADPIVHQLLENYGEDVYYVFRHYPLSIHKNAKKAAQAAEAAASQGKFFEMVEKLYASQSDWQDSGNAQEHFETYAAEIGLNIDQFKSEINQFNDPIESDFALGNRFGVQSTPTFFINGERYSGVVQLAQFEQIINSSKEKTNGANTSESPDQQPVED